MQFRCEVSDSIDLLSKRGVFSLESQLQYFTTDIKIFSRMKIKKNNDKAKIVLLTDVLLHRLQKIIIWST
jgi:hypothetical protein